MGFKDFNLMNSAHLAKQAWRAIQHQEALWVQVLKGIYHPGENFVNTRKRRNASWTWTSQIHGNEILMKSARWLIGSGEKIKIAKDSWIASGDIIDEFNHQGLEYIRDLI